MEVKGLSGVTQQVNNRAGESRAWECAGLSPFARGWTVTIRASRGKGPGPDQQLGAGPGKKRWALQPCSLAATALGNIMGPPLGEGTVSPPCSDPPGLQSGPTCQP